MPLHKPYIRFFISIYLLCNIHCKEAYTPPAVKNNPGFLVVDGFLTSVPDSTYITLTRTRNMADTSTAPPETNAVVTVEGEFSGTMPLPEIRAGIYGNLLPLDIFQKYRLTIRTSGGAAYSSDFIPFKITPPIDSLSWKEDSNQVSIMVSTHDPGNNSRYYRWAYEETWLYHTFFTSNFNYENDNVVTRSRDSLIYFCYTTKYSPDIQLGTSANLSQDQISNIDVHNVSKASEKIYEKYSILVKQYALTREQFDYWTNLKKNSENLGTLFDAQPSQLSGNIHCTSNPSETVLGDLYASTVTRKRMFINRNQVALYFVNPYFLPCQINGDVTLVIDGSDKQKAYDYLEKPGHLYTFLYDNYGYHIAENLCADCREHGGTIMKPDFWP